MPMAAAGWYHRCLLSCAIVGFNLAGTHAVPLHGKREPVPPVRWVLDERASLAWWQINPHLGDLWGTTCPAETSWHAGRAQDPMRHEKSKLGYAGVMDTVIPLYPRPVPMAVCAPGVSGAFEAADTVSWQGVRGRVVVDVHLLTSGMPSRDTYARNSLLHAGTFPTIEFTVDSLIGAERHGDTVTASAVGVFHFHGADQPMTVPIRVWHDPLGLRVTGQTHFPATELITTYYLSKVGLGLGVASHVWKQLYWGIDAILVPAAAAGAN